jgi:hypothetical protein
MNTNLMAGIFISAGSGSYYDYLFQATSYSRQPAAILSCYRIICTAGKSADAAISGCGAKNHRLQGFSFPDAYNDRSLVSGLAISLAHQIRNQTTHSS